ncbi:hypothetical protein HYY74_02090 [Candidatus Woesearchaeota archaeon]|nr:hypothetical protein [Candidatus Woesearchaeota archaeon]
MKKACLAILLSMVLAAAIASGGISIDSINKKQLNLGDKLAVSYNLTSEKDVEALFKLSLKCTSFDLDYYTIPVMVKAGSNKSVVAAPLTINSQMMGQCSVNAVLQATDKTSIEELESDKFDVTNNIIVKLAVPSGKAYYPGERVTIAGEVTESFSPARMVTIVLERQTVTMAINSEYFNQTMELPKTIKSGLHKIQAEVNDTHGNRGFAEEAIEIAQVPTSILIDISKDRASPGDEVKIYTIILDQANDSMAGTVSVKLTSQDKKELLSMEVDSHELFKYKFDEYAAPGVYTLRAASQGLKNEKKIIITTVEEATASFDGQRIITVKNTGNVPYERQFETRLTSEAGEIPIGKNLNLQPGQETKVDLFQEAPAGTYKVSFTSAGQRMEYPGITTRDERNLGKKTMDGLGGITGAVFGTGSTKGIIFRKPILALFTVLAIVVLVVIVFQSEQNRRKELLKKKQEEAAMQNKLQEEIQTVAKEDSLSLDREKHQKFVQNMLKEKEFK